jgi:hypothetical protein
MGQVSTAVRADPRPLPAPYPPGPARPPTGWVPAAVRAGRAGGEAALLGWLCAVVPALVAYSATAGLPALGEATWTHAALVGAATWRLAHGVPADAGGWAVTLVPIGLTLCAGGLVLWSVRRARLLTWSGGLGAVVGYALAAALLALVAPAGGRQPLAILPGALAVGSVGALAALGLRRGGLPTLPSAVRARLDRLPAVLGVVLPEGARAAGSACLSLVVLGTLLVVASVAGATAGFGDILATLRIDTVSAVMLVLASLALVPTLAVWGVAWAAGPGFAVGAGTLVAPGDVVLGPMPAVPVLAGLPAPDGVWAHSPWAPLAVVLLGALSGWWLHRRRPRAGAGSGLGAAAASALVAALGCAGVVWLLCAASSGAVGPGRMGEVGPVAPDVAAAVAVEVAVGALAVVVAGHATTRALVRRGAATVVGRLRGRPAGGDRPVRGSAGS